MRTALSAALFLTCGLCVLMSTSAARGEERRVQIEVTQQWKMHDFSSSKLALNDSFSGSGSLSYGGTLTLTPTGEHSVKLTWECQRIRSYRTLRGGNRTGFTLKRFNSRKRLKRALRRHLVEYRPLLRFPAAAAYEAQTLGILMALMDGQTVTLDLTQPFFAEPSGRHGTYPTDELVASWLPQWPSDNAPNPRWETLWRYRDGDGKNGTYYLPFHQRVRALFTNQLKVMALFALLDSHRGILKTMDLPLDSKGHRLPRISLPVLQGWSMVDREQLVIPNTAWMPPKSFRRDHDPDEYDEAPRSNPKGPVQEAAEKRDKIRISDAKRGKIRLNGRGKRSIVLSQQLLDAQARLWKLEKGEFRHFPEPPSVASRTDLWFLSSRGVKHDHELNRGRSRTRLTVSTEVPSNRIFRWLSPDGEHIRSKLRAEGSLKIEARPASN